jgi:triosephosphate isomerase
LIEYERGLLESVIDEQLRGCLANVDAKILLSDRIILAYEPVWAIGTGLTATPSQAQYAHEVIRASLAKYYGSEEVASSVRIQYGGSVTPESMEALMSEKDVDGALVGGASLNADSFTRIYDGAVLVAEANKKKAS